MRKKSNPVCEKMLACLQKALFKNVQFVLFSKYFDPAILLSFPPSPRLVPMALADITMPVEERQDLATAVHRVVASWDEANFAVADLDLPGPNFASGDTYWRGDFSVE